MIYLYLADFVVLLHAAFILFVLLGGLLVLWKPFLAWFHIPAVLWAAFIEFIGFICPLTPLENMLRSLGGSGSYGTGFIEHYIMPVLYPSALTRNMQIGLGLFVVGLNLVIYVLLLNKKRSGNMPQ